MTLDKAIIGERITAHGSMASIAHQSILDWAIKAQMARMTICTLGAARVLSIATTLISTCSISSICSRILASRLALPSRQNLSRRSLLNSRCKSSLKGTQIFTLRLTRHKKVQTREVACLKHLLVRASATEKSLLQLNSKQRMEPWCLQRFLLLP